MNWYRQSLCAVAAFLLLVASPTRTVLGDEPPFARWVTMGTREGWSGGGAAVSPSGELFVSAAVDHAHAYDRARPGQGPYPVFTRALLRIDHQGRILSTNRLVAVTYEQTAFDADGNRYLTGNFDTNGPWSGFVTSTNYLFNPAEVRGFFLAKYDAADQLLWVRSQAMADNAKRTNRGRRIIQDSAGNLVVGIESDGAMTLGNFSLGAGRGPVIAKYDRNGQVLWARRIASAGGLDGLALDPSGHFIVCGFLPEGSVDFSGTTVYPGSTGLAYSGDWYLARLKPNGDLDWVKLGYAQSLAVGRTGDIYTTFSKSKVSDGSGLAKFNSAGDLLWSKFFLGPVYVGSVVIDNNDTPVFTGRFDDTVLFDDFVLTPTSQGWGDIVLARMDGSGRFLWAISGGGPELDSGGQVIVDGQGNIFLIGQARKEDGTFEGLPLTPIPPPEDNVFATLFAAKLDLAPRPEITLNEGSLVVSWPAGAPDYLLEATTSLPAVSWTTVTNTPAVTTTERSVQLPVTGNARFFRLRKP